MRTRMSRTTFQTMIYFFGDLKQPKDTKDIQQKSRKIYDTLQRCSLERSRHSFERYFSSWKDDYIFQRKGTLVSKDMTSLHLWHLYIFGKTPKMPKDKPNVFLMSRTLHSTFTIPVPLPDFDSASTAESGVGPVGMNPRIAPQ